MSETAVFAGIVLGGLLYWLITSTKKPGRYRRKPLLTGRERDFFYRLRRALPDCLIFPKMAVSALIEPTGTGGMRTSARRTIEGQKVGFAVFDMEMHLVAVVELDHGVRLSSRATAREACLEQSGIRVVRFPARRLPSEANIHSTIYARKSKGAAHTDKEGQAAVIEFKPKRSPWRNTMNVHI